MCGIFGALKLSGAFTRSDYERFVCSTDLVAYRGPDDSDYRAYRTDIGDEAEPGAFNAFLGHRRLSIFDLSSSGRQPLTDGRGRWIVFNGAIFNYPELRTELRRRGHQFATATDTEVILRLYAEEGEQAFARLNGMWALAILDLPARRVVLSRDRFSIKPLYYLKAGRDLYFASEIKQLLPYLGRREVNRRIMHAYLTQGLTDHTSETFFEGIQSVKAKHNLVVELDTGTSTERPYWAYGVPGPVAEDPIEQFRELFVDSVRIRLRSDVSVGAMLSGGLDSSSIAVVADQVLGANLETYSVVSRDPRYCEEPYIDQVAQTGIPNRRILFDSIGAQESLDAVIWHNDEPTSSLSAIAQYRMLEQMKQETGIKVVLNGQGGDECLLGYRKFFFFHLLNLMRSGRAVAAFRLFWSSWRQKTAITHFRLSEAQRYLPIQRFKRRMPYVLSHQAPEKMHRAADIRDRQMQDLDRFSIPVLAHFDDRSSMAHVVELRTPFLDHRLVELALNLPVDMKLRGGWSKYILRDAFPELPPGVRWRREKRGFSTPEEAWLHHEFKPLIERQFHNGTSRLGELGIIDAHRFLDFYSDYLRGDSTIWYADVSRVLMAELWVQRFLSD